jgi:hypothetical protein
METAGAPEAVGAIQVNSMLQCNSMEDKLDVGLPVFSSLFDFQDTHFVENTCLRESLAFEMLRALNSNDNFQFIRAMVLLTCDLVGLPRG